MTSVMTASVGSVPPSSGAIVRIGKSGPLAVRAGQTIRALPSLTAGGAPTRGLKIPKSKALWWLGAAALWELGSEVSDYIDYQQLINEANGDQGPLGDVGKLIAGYDTILEGRGQLKSLIKDINELCSMDFEAMQTAEAGLRINSETYTFKDDASRALVWMYLRTISSCGTRYAFAANDAALITVLDAYMLYRPVSADQLDPSVLDTLPDVQTSMADAYSINFFADSTRYFDFLTFIRLTELHGVLADIGSNDRAAAGDLKIREEDL